MKETLKLLAQLSSAPAPPELQLGFAQPCDAVKVGAGVDLKFANNLFSNEDFTGGLIGTVSDFCGPAILGYPIPQTSYACLHYGTYPVFEANWSPYGNASLLCAGVAVPAASQNVTLQSCGRTSRTLWILDASKAKVVAGKTYYPAINGSDTQFSDPLVLTVNTGSKSPANTLTIARENTLTGGAVQDDQMFTITQGPVA